MESSSGSRLQRCWCAFASQRRRLTMYDALQRGVVDDSAALWRADPFCRNLCSAVVMLERPALKEGSETQLAQIVPVEFATASQLVYPLHQKQQVLD